MFTGMAWVWVGEWPPFCVCPNGFWLSSAMPGDGVGMLPVGEEERTPGEFGPGGDAWGTLKPP